MSPIAGMAGIGTSTQPFQKPITYAAKAAEFGLGTADTRLFTLGSLIEE